VDLAAVSPLAQHQLEDRLPFLPASRRAAAFCFTAGNAWT